MTSCNPIEVRLFPDRMEVLSFPGPMPPITLQMLQKKQIPSRNYRNRRIGDFLKELNLTEGRATGFPIIRREMQKNGSPDPVFETDEDRTYFLSILPIHPQAQVEAQVGAQDALTEVEIKILNLCRQGNLSSKEILEGLGYKGRPGNVTKALPRLINLELLAYTSPDKPRSKNQKYRITDKGRQVLAGLSA
ncbi:MAG: hypothetical protein H7Y04_15900 [Verrucomicrobia bacterium]|nr:hypothetical protein [Cytophagales bacterium]